MKCLLALALAAAAFAQPPARAEFEVASIKPNRHPTDGMSVHHSDGLWRATNITAKSVILNAFEILEEQIIGAPAWISSEHFDIEARFEADPKDDGQRQRERLQTLLATRFQLQFHRETKEWQTYVLVPAKKGAKLAAAAAPEHSSMRSNNGHMEVKGGNMENLTRNLAARLGKPVVDETGLKGSYDYTVDYEAAMTGTDSAKPSLFTALQDQLGLRLETRKSPVELLVIDRIERPSDN